MLPSKTHKIARTSTADLLEGSCQSVIFRTAVHSEASRSIVPEDNTDLNGSPQAPYQPQASLVRVNHGFPC
ncbi:UNVERIFIED_CONTAM: hypothetical protein FKN15_000319 [Acipenser sinensis]